MRITVLTLFPQLFEIFKDISIIKKAIQRNLVNLEFINFRNYATDKHKKVDDTAFGGGAGMVLMLDPIVKCLSKIKTKNSKVFLLSPEGKLFNQKIAYKLVQNVDHLILICGHYEGFDYRIHNYVDDVISLGDFILTGGELVAMIIIDAVTRLIPNVINKNSLINESFNNYLLDYPSYTKPVNYDGFEVPKILLSGNHKLINEFNRTEQIRITKNKRPDLYKKYLKLMKGKKNVGSKNK